LRFYFSSILDFTEELPLLGFPDFSKLEFIENKKIEATQLYEKLSNISLKKQTKDTTRGSDPILAALLLQSSKLQLPDKVDVKISTERKSKVKKNALEVLGINIDDDIFEFGDLKTGSLFIVMPFGPDKSIFGTDKEKEKFELFEKFEEVVEVLNDLLSFLSKFNSYQIVPLILRNNGEQFNESIRILLQIPKKVELLTPDRFPIPSMLDNLIDLNDSDSFLFYFLHHHKDSKVYEYYKRSFVPIIDNYMPFRESDEQKLSRERKKYKNKINDYFDFDVFTDDNPDHLILSCEIDELNPHDAISLPCFLLIKSDEDVTLTYEINSKHLQNKIIDTLKIKTK